MVQLNFQSSIRLHGVQGQLFLFLSFIPPTFNNPVSCAGCISDETNVQAEHRFHPNILLLKKDVGVLVSSSLTKVSQ
jgi:hypothetical protein